MPTCGSNGLRTSAEPEPELLVDTSVAVAIVLADHEAHKETLEAVDGKRLGLAGHAWFDVLGADAPASQIAPVSGRRQGHPGA